MVNAFLSAKTNSICTEGSYPYITTGQAGIPQGGVVDYTDVYTDSEMSAVAQQLVPIATETDQYSSQLYSSGVSIASCGTDFDHGVSAVGYGSDAETDYWKVKSSWGEQGYVRLQWGKGDAGECGLPTSCSLFDVGGDVKRWRTLS